MTEGYDGLHRPSDHPWKVHKVEAMQPPRIVLVQGQTNVLDKLQDM